MPSTLAATIWAISCFASVSAHLSMIAIEGSNNIIGHGFGVDLTGKYPRAGTEGDAGGDSGVFETGTDNPSPACGNTPELGPLDIPAWLNQAEGFGLPAAYPNMSVVAKVFQVNRDGGGPMSCQYSSDATATSWQDMVMSLNQAGNDGIKNVLRYNSTVVMNFPEDAVCNGGFTKTACIVRCRTGVNKRFGGCFAVKLAGTASALVSTTDSPTLMRDANIATGSSDQALTDQQLEAVAQKVFAQMKSNGFVVASTSSTADDTSADSGNATSMANAPERRATTDSTAGVSMGSIRRATRHSRKTTSGVKGCQV